MTELVLDHPRDDAKTIVKASIEQMRSIDAYTDEGQRIVAKQEASLTGGNGARLIINVPEMQESEDKTVIKANAEKEVSIDMATNPQDIKSEFLNTVNTLRERDVNELLDQLNQQMSPKDTKEVNDFTNFGSTEAALGKRFVIYFLIMMAFTMLFGLIMTAMIMP